MPANRAHPVFARLYARVSPGMERAGSAEHRAEALQDLAGRVIEVGAGNGLNFAHYPATVTEVLAVEPEPYLRRLAAEAAAGVPVQVSVAPGHADRLPAEDASFDAGVASLVLCSVPDPERALAELFRVLRPGGELRFYEHIRAEEPKLARLQDRVDPLWHHLAGGCHCNRDTVGTLARTGFEIETARRFVFEPHVTARLVGPHVIGTARRP